MSIFGKGSKLYSIFGFKCPKCHEGDMFHTPTFSFKRSFDMKKNCEVCGQDFEPEPGFYYGAMFVSYIFMGFFCLGFTAFFHWVVGLSVNMSFLLLLIVVAIFFVFIFRLARSIWINIVIKYNPPKKVNN